MSRSIVDNILNVQVRVINRRDGWTACAALGATLTPQCPIASLPSALLQRILVGRHDNHLRNVQGGRLLDDPARCHDYNAEELGGARKLHSNAPVAAGGCVGVGGFARFLQPERSAGGLVRSFWSTGADDRAATPWERDGSTGKPHRRRQSPAPSQTLHFARCISIPRYDAVTETHNTCNDTRTHIYLHLLTRSRTHAHAHTGGADR